MYDTPVDRETSRVSELPPPPVPPPVPPDTGSDTRSDTRSGPRSDARSGTGSDAASHGGWDWDRARDLAERWFRPLADERGWAALGYLFFGALTSVAFFAVTWVFGWAVFGLLFAVVGVFLVVPFFALVATFAEVDRGFARMAGYEIEARPLVPLRGLGPRSALAAVRDPARWRQVGYRLADVVIGPMFLVIGAFPATVVIQVVFGASFGWGPAGLLALPIGALAAGAIPRAAIWMAGIKAQVDGWFLGADRLAAAEQRVSALATQRQDILDAVAEERRRIERNLHDGVQQQLVAIGLDLGMAANQLDRAAAGDVAAARQLVESARAKVQGSIGELRQLGRGLHPAILSDRGIDAALSAVVSGAPIPISVHVDEGLDLSTDVAETVYFVANEAIANVLKHSRATVASIHVMRVAANVRVTVHDDGIGGADPGRGTGIAGIRARVHAMDGVLIVTSPEGGPTTLTAEIPREHRPEDAPDA